MTIVASAACYDTTSQLGNLTRVEENLTIDLVIAF